MAALSADQRAMLQLLLERDQNYEDIASLLDVDVDEVRSRARAALAELGGENPDREVALTDYLLGQADPIGRADAVRHLQNDAETLSLASDLEAKLRMVAPQAELPQLPKQRSARAGRLRRRRAAATGPAEPEAAAAEPGAGAADRLRGALSHSQQRVIVALGGLAVLLIAGVLAVAGAFSGGGEESSSATTNTTTAASSSSGNDEVLADVTLKGQGGSDAKGKAVFGVASGDQAYLDASVENVSPAPQGQTYVLWLLLSPKQGYPLSPLQIGQNGRFSDRFPIPQFAVQIASRARFVDISLTQNSDLQQQLPKAVKQGNPLLNYSGESIARGEIPVQQGAQGAPGAPGGG
jgi:hypothetical protein